jgi:formate dehydrogenase (coenzyme F420) beta subunit
MKALQNKAAELFGNGTIQLLIGFQEGVGSAFVPGFFEEASQLDKLVFTPECRNNLSVYLHKPEVKQAQKIGIVGNIATLRSLLQLMSENQFWNLEITVLTIEGEDVIQLSHAEELETYVQTHFPDYRPEDLDMLEKLKAMTREERWAFWKDQFSACVKCYACRAVCPMCYCPQCTVECNQPQWIRLSSETSGNFEWHTMRAMHLAGRCINCGECGRVCPAGIPIHLLTVEMNQEIEKEFGGKTGFSKCGGYAMNSFKPGDSENFIK